MENTLSHNIRLAVFDWLNQVAAPRDFILDFRDVTNEFKYNGQIVKLMGPKGIWKPQMMDKYPISITSVQKSIYSDEFIDDDTLFYSYRGTDPSHPDNVGLRNAMMDNIPLVYFHQVLKGRYFVAWPVFMVGDEPDKLRFMVSAETYKAVKTDWIMDDPSTTYRRKYETREVLVRLHQQSFRERVIKAYNEHCAVCHLKHRELLDAAHILSDSSGGEPTVSNGLSLCKIHHAAYDKNIIGINPDYYIEVRNDILKEVDGPMLRYGLQEMNGHKLIVPRSAINKPDKDALSQRYEIFKRA